MRKSAKNTKIVTIIEFPAFFLCSSTKKFSHFFYSCNIDNCLNPCDGASDVSTNCKLNEFNLLLGEISKDSLAVEGTYILAKKSIGQSSGTKNLYTSHNRGAFQKAVFTHNKIRSFQGYPELLSYARTAPKAQKIALACATPDNF